MAKSADAFRTISEVSDVLGTPAHVLRFWESKFSQIKPVKRAGGRRYYRPQDISLLAGIKHLLHDQGMTIKGAQKLLREKGVKHVAGLIDMSSGETRELEGAAPTPEPPAPVEATKADVTPAPEEAPVTEEPSARATQVDLPLPDTAPAGPRFFDALQQAKPSALAARADEIAPLLQRLTEVRDRIDA